MVKPNFTIVNGKWVTGNLNDRLVAASFDVFINLKRKLHPNEQKRVRKDLSIHNYKFNSHGKNNESKCSS